MIQKINVKGVLKNGIYAVFITETTPSGTYIAPLTYQIKVKDATGDDSVLDALGLSRLTHHITGVTKLTVVD